MRGGHFGRLARSRRAWNPRDLGGCILWLAGDAVTLDGSNNVSTWRDQSGAGHHATQATGGLRPARTTLSGRPALRFDNGKALGIAAFLDGLAACTFVMVHSTTTDPDGNGAIFGSVASGTGIEIIDLGASTKRTRINSSTVTDATYANGVRTISTLVFDGGVGGGTATLRKNGVDVATVGSLGATLSASGGHQIGAYAGSFYADTTVSDLFAFSSALAAANVSKLEAFFR